MESNDPFKMLNNGEDSDDHISEEEFAVHDAMLAAELAPAYDDPYVIVKEMLWLLPGINEIVWDALERIEKAFTYNSVYFLKVVIELQATYLSMNPSPPPDTLLDVSLVLGVAEVLAGSMSRRKKKESSSLSRELQLRTLVSALELLGQYNVGMLDNDTYAKLLKDVSERDAENRSKRAKGKRNKLGNGDNEFLVRYTCDLIRCIPSELPMFKELNSEAVHFIFAAGLINQLDGEITKSTIDEVFARITAAPSEWHKDMQYMYEGTAGAIALHHQAQSKTPNRASAYACVLAADVARSIIERAEYELETLSPKSDSLFFGLEKNGSCGNEGKVLPSHEAQLLVSGLLDLLNQLVSAFQRSEYVVGGAKALALELIQYSEKREFRYKAFEIIIASTTGSSEAEYYNTMRSLDIEIENTAKASGYFDTRSEDEKLRALDRVEELKKEKREAMDRCEKKTILFKGAVESMQRRFQGSRSANMSSEAMAEVLHMSTPWDDEVRSDISASPVPSSLPSQAPTLSSQNPTCESSSGTSPTTTPICDSLVSLTSTQVSPMSSTSCQSFSSPTDSCHTIIDPQLYPMEPLPGLLPQNMTHNLGYAPQTPHEAITPSLDSAMDFHRLGQMLSEPDLPFFDEPEIYDDLQPEGTDVRKLSFELPIQSFDMGDDESEEPLSLQIPECSAERQFLNVPMESGNRSSTADSSYSIINQPHMEISSPASLYPEPSLSRTPSGQTQAGTIRRQSRAGKIFARRPGHVAGRESKRVQSLQLNKPLPPVVNLERPKDSILAESAPEPVNPGAPAQPVPHQPPRCQSAMEVRNESSDLLYINNSNSSLGHFPDYNSLRRASPMFSSVESLPKQADIFVEYESQPLESAFKVHPKDSCFGTFISSDCKNTIFLSPHLFQVFAIPSPGEVVSTKPRFYYRLGETEGLKKGKAPWQYRAAAASDKYIVTVTRERLQVHDIQQECKVIFTETTKGWDHTCVDISAEKLVVGMSKSLRGENLGMIRIYKLNAPTYPGPRCERWRDTHLPINPRIPQDAPHVITISKDSNFLACGTPKFGYFFSWDISRVGEPSLIGSGRLKPTEGSGSETLTNAILFPDSKHILCSTFPTSITESEWIGSFTEPTSVSSGTPNHRPIRQVGLSVHHSAIAPHGDAAAFLTQSGTVWVTPVAFLNGDNNLTTFAPTHSKERMQNQQVAGSGGKIAFSPEGDRLVAVDRKGKILVLSFKTFKITTLVSAANQLGIGSYF